MTRRSIGEVILEVRNISQKEKKVDTIKKEKDK